MANQKKVIDLKPEEIKALVDMVYGENASEDDDVIKMTTSTAINRLLSGRKKEFGGTLSEVINAPNSYYAIKDKKNKAYQQAIGGTLDKVGKRRYAEVETLINAMLSDQQFMPGMFYFKPEEELKLRKNKKAFDFNKVKRTGKIGPYNVYSY